MKDDKKYCEHCGFEIFDDLCECQEWKDELNENIKDYN